MTKFNYKYIFKKYPNTSKKSHAHFNVSITTVQGLKKECQLKGVGGVDYTK
jgi:hypothetical protein